MLFSSGDAAAKAWFVIDGEVEVRIEHPTLGVPVVVEAITASGIISASDLFLRTRLRTVSAAVAMLGVGLAIVIPCESLLC